MPDNTDQRRRPELVRPEWLPTEVWPNRLRTHSWGGQVLHYLDEGPDRPDAPTLVLVHAGTWSFIWRDLIDRLRSEYRCLSIDFPGAGLSTGDPGDVELPAFAELVGHWLDHLGIDRATLVLHDLGGLVGVTAAAAKPERVDGLIAVNCFAWPAQPFALRAMLAIMGGPTMTGIFGSLRVVPRLTSTRYGVGRHLTRPERRAFYGPYVGRPDRGRGFHRAMASARRSGELAARAEGALLTTLSHLPVLTIYGEKNDPFGLADRWRELFPTATSHVVPGGNHFPMCDAPDDVAGWIEDWVATRSRARWRSGPAPACG